jgi:hypothetical protein
MIESLKTESYRAPAGRYRGHFGANSPIAKSRERGANMNATRRALATLVLPLDWWERHAVELPRQGEGVALSWDPTPLAEAVA